MTNLLRNRNSSRLLTIYFVLSPILAIADNDLQQLEEYYEKEKNGDFVDEGGFSCPNWLSNLPRCNGGEDKPLFLDFLSTNKVPKPEIERLTSLDVRNKYACSLKKSLNESKVTSLQSSEDNVMSLGTLVDLNGDSILDFYANSEVYETFETPAVVTLGGDSNQEDLSGATTGMIHLRKVAVSDINGDGLDDLLLIGHGWDKPPFPGEYPKLALSDSKEIGKYDIKPLKAAGKSFWHSGAVGDLNNDGRIDLLLVSTSVDSPPYTKIGYQEITGEFDFQQLDRTGDAEAQRMVAGEIIDVDKDGLNDIVVSSHFGSVVTVYWGSQQRSFANKTSVKLPGNFNHAIDLNFRETDTGSPSIIAVTTRTEPWYIGLAYFEISVDPKLRKLSKPSLIYKNIVRHWTPWVYVCDLDGDSREEVFDYITPFTVMRRTLQDEPVHFE